MSMPDGSEKIEADSYILMPGLINAHTNGHGNLANWSSYCWVWRCWGALKHRTYDRGYNTLINTPYPYSHETLWRLDSIYDIIIELGYNDNPPTLDRGSAIFMHLARPNFDPTAGCIALKKSDLLNLLSLVSYEDLVKVVIWTINLSVSATK